MSSTSAVHNVDQRSPVVRFTHDALPCAVECAQRGPGQDGFVADTSSVIWACGMLLPQHLCEHPETVRGKRCCELGAGIGLAGAVAFALGASDVLVTDAASAMPLLELNAQRNAALAAAPDATLRAQELLWGEPAQLDAAGRAGYDVLLGADIVYHQSREEMVLLAETIAGLLAPGGVMLLAYEWREDWETTDAFHEECEARGLVLHRSQLSDADMDDQVLFTLWWGGAGPPAAAAAADAPAAASELASAPAAATQAEELKAAPAARDAEAVATCFTPSSCVTT
eukprot:Transcript_22867.p1 GENE.Transcript_22867~~Transcript_22867.p1  ORF type:complete len:308 (+),score=74.08 Transcript_22867:73-924(+)